MLRTFCKKKTPTQGGLPSNRRGICTDFTAGWGHRYLQYICQNITNYNNKKIFVDLWEILLHNYNVILYFER